MVQPATKVGRQDFDIGVGRQCPDVLDAFNEMAGAAVVQIIAVNRGDDDVIEFHQCDVLGKAFRLVEVQRVWTPRANVTEPAAPRTFVAHDHEGCRAFAPALADVGAGGLFAPRHQFVGAHNVLDLPEAACGWQQLDANPVWFWQSFGWIELGAFGL